MIKHYPPHLGGEVSEHTIAAVDSVLERGHKITRLTADRGYNGGMKKENLHLPMKERGIPLVVDYNTKQRSATKDRQSDEPSETSAVAAPGPACVSAFEAAAAVPLDQINDTEMVRTVSECTTVDEWSAGIERYPEALGMTQAPTWADLPMTLGTVCFGNESAAMCQDAAPQGLLQ